MYACCKQIRDVVASLSSIYSDKLTLAHVAALPGRRVKGGG